ncbi:MAG: hypothetical protein ABI041_00575 [Bdellovibrionia bacterium]
MYLIFSRLAFISILSFVGAEAKADTASAKSAWDKAYNDFYQAIRPLTNPSPEQINELNKKILVPAKENYIQEKHAEHVKNHPVNKGKENQFRKKKVSRARPELLLDDVGTVENPIAKPASNSYPSASRYDARPDQSREEVVLDGKDIPKEIEFAPAKKLKPKK